MSAISAPAHQAAAVTTPSVTVDVSPDSTGRQRISITIELIIGGAAGAAPRSSPALTLAATGSPFPLQAAGSAIPPPIRPAPPAPPAPSTPATPIQAAIEDFAAYMERRGKKPASIAEFKRYLKKAALEEGWTHVEHCTALAVEAWLGRYRSAWRGVTFNRNLSIFRSFSRYLVRFGHLPADTVGMLEHAQHDPGDGSRAATVTEASAFMLEAMKRQRSSDRRVCKSPVALYYACLFAHGCRAGEPEQWQRKHLALDHEYPHVQWEGSISKNHKRADIVLHPNLAAMLREHLAQDDRARAESGRPAAGPEDKVFGVLPTKAFFRTIRRAAGIGEADYRGRRLTPHSARKFFSTALTGAGVPEKMVDRLMRHAGRVEYAYYDPTLAEQAAAIAMLPDIWPD